MNTKCPDCGKLISLRFPMHDCKPKNKHAQALGRLGGRKPGFTGKPLDPAKARAMVAARWAKYRANKQTTQTP